MAIQFPTFRDLIRSSPRKGGKHADGGRHRTAGNDRGRRTGASGQHSRSVAAGRSQSDSEPRSPRHAYDDTDNRPTAPQRPARPIPTTHAVPVHGHPVTIPRSSRPAGQHRTREATPNTGGTITDHTGQLRRVPAGGEWLEPRARRDISEPDRAMGARGHAQVPASVPRLQQRFEPGRYGTPRPEPGRHRKPEPAQPFGVTRTETPKPERPLLPRQRPEIGRHGAATGAPVPAKIGSSRPEHLQPHKKNKQGQPAGTAELGRRAYNFAGFYWSDRDAK